MPQDHTYDLAVVGGGILGTFHAFHALKKGLRVALFERHRTPQGATVRNFGQIVPSGMDEKWQNYGRRSLEIYKDLQSKTDLTVKAEGTIYFASDPEELALIEELSEINQHRGYASVLLSKSKCLERYPGLRADYVKAGLYFPDELSVYAREMINRVQAYMHSFDNFYHFPATPIIGVDEQSERPVLHAHSGNQYSASKVLICSGNEFRMLFPEQFKDSEIEVTKLQMLRTLPMKVQKIPGNILSGLSIRRYESFRECPSYKEIKSKEDPDSLVKQWGVHLLFKQNPDGSVIIGDSHLYADASRQEELDFSLRHDINLFMLREAQRIYGLEHWNIAETWAGFYAQCKTDDLFDRKVAENIHIITAIGGKGMTASPAFAEEKIQHLFN